MLNKRILASTGAAVAALLLQACSANYNTAYRLRSLPNEGNAVLTIDAKQRNVLINRKGAFARMCAEPSPDVFSVFAQTVGASLSGGSANPQQIEAAASLALARSENGATISRTQTSNVVREMLFRTCERYLNGALTPEELAIQAIRDQRMVISILAIEQLTGAVTPPTVIIRASGDASTGTATTETVKAITAAQDKLNKAKTAAAAAQETRNALDKEAPKCADLKADETETARKTKQAACVKADKAVETAEAARETAQDEYKVLSAAVLKSGLPTAASTTTEASVVAGLNRASNEQVQAVTGSINNIINRVYEQDEFLLFCIRNIGSDKPEISQACLTYVTTEINVLARKRDPQIFAQVQQQLRNTDEANFERFWSAVNNGAVPPLSDIAKVKAALKPYRDYAGKDPPRAADLNAIEAAPLSKDQLKALFGRLMPAQQAAIANQGESK